MKYKQHLPKPQHTTRHLVACFWLLVVWWSPSQPGHALSMKRPDFRAISWNATHIIRGRVVSQQKVESKLLPMLETHFTSIRCWTDTCPSSFSIRVPDIKPGKRVIQLSGIPRFSPGQQVILFLRKTSQRPLLLVGLYYGVFDLQQTPRGLFVTSRGHLLPRLHFADFQQRLQRERHARTCARQHHTKEARKSCLQRKMQRVPSTRPNNPPLSGPPPAPAPNKTPPPAREERSTR